MAGDYTLVRPVLEQRSLDVAAEAEAKRRTREAWERWDLACQQAPACRVVLAQIEELLPQIEANLTAADRQLAAAQWARVHREQIGPGGDILQAPTGEATYMVFADEEARDPAIVTANAERQKWIGARGRLWAQADAAKAVLAHAESQRPPGERPRD